MVVGMKRACRHDTFLFFRFYMKKYDVTENTFTVYYIPMWYVTFFDDNRNKTKKILCSFNGKGFHHLYSLYTSFRKMKWKYGLWVLSDNIYMTVYKNGKSINKLYLRQDSCKTAADRRLLLESRRPSFLVCRACCTLIGGHPLVLQYPH